MDDEKCYEFFDCKKMNCVRRNVDDKQCWEIENTLCDTYNDSVKKMQSAMGDKARACKFCIYYQTMTKHENNK